ncbi:MAG: hypothetical protein IJC24_05710 [Clostridia bacterium]|nr:hypothetical protein [Clostridia bacterium]
MKTKLIFLISIFLLLSGCSASTEQIVTIQADSTPLPAVTPVLTSAPAQVPSAAPVPSPTSIPEPTSSADPTPKIAETTDSPTPAPTEQPTVSPTPVPTVQPTSNPTSQPVTEPTAEPTENSDASDFGGSILALVNSFRNDAGLDSLKYSSDMQSAADTRAKECAVSFSHTRPDGSSSYTALTERGLSFTAFGENIFAATGMDSVSAEFVVEQWMASQGHRENILMDGFTHMCIGIAAKDDEVYVVQLFGAGIS